MRGSFSISFQLISLRVQFFLIAHQNNEKFWIYQRSSKCVCCVCIKITHMRRAFTFRLSPSLHAIANASEFLVVACDLQHLHYSYLEIDSISLKSRSLLLLLLLFQIVIFHLILLHSLSSSSNWIVSARDSEIFPFATNSLFSLNSSFWERKNTKMLVRKQKQNQMKRGKRKRHWNFSDFVLAFDNNYTINFWINFLLLSLILNAISLLMMYGLSSQLHCY